MKQITDEDIEKTQRRTAIGVLSTMLIIGLCLFCGAWALEQLKLEPHPKKIDLPEEINIVTGNEKLYIQSVTKDSIHIGFDNRPYYELYITDNSIIVEDNGHVIYKELITDKPTPLIKALIEDNE